MTMGHADTRDPCPMRAVDRSAGACRTAKANTSRHQQWQNRKPCGLTPQASTHLKQSVEQPMRLAAYASVPHLRLCQVPLLPLGLTPQVLRIPSQPRPAMANQQLLLQTLLPLSFTTLVPCCTC